MTFTRGGGTSQEWGPHATTFCEHTTAMIACVEQMLGLVQLTEQDSTTLRTQRQEIEERTKRKAAQAVQATQARAKKELDEAHVEFHHQLSEANQTIANFRNQVANLELELSTTQEQVDAIAKEKTLATERAQCLEQQHAEAMARCRTLNEALAQGTSTQSTASRDAEELARLQQLRVEVENARESWETNKVNWAQQAARVVATNAYRILWANPPQGAVPPTEFLEKCVDDALVDLDVEQSEPNWDGMEMDFMDIDAVSMAALSQDHNTPPNDPRRANFPAQEINMR